MSEKPLVSIITPCYNGAEFIDGYFRSILAQTYPNLELIFIDDGSTDATAQIADSYRPALEERNIKFIYIYQNNQGQAAALNQGLAIFRGDYFVWPDSDDLLTPDSIAKRVNFLETNPEYGFVRSNAEYFDYDTKKPLYRASNAENRFALDIFSDLILENTYCCCGCYMVRREAFLAIYPERHIEVSSAGQNWQMLIPISAHYKCGYIDEDLYRIAVRNHSHSRSDTSYEIAVNRQNTLKEILLSSIAVSGRNDRDYGKMVNDKYIGKYLYLAAKYGKHEDAKKYRYELKKRGIYTSDKKIIYLKAFYPILHMLYLFLLRVKGKIKRTFWRNNV